MKRRILKFTALPFLIAGLAAACSKKQAAQQAVSAAHNAAQCPDSLRGQLFNAQDTKNPMFIEVVDDKDNKRLNVAFNAIEFIPVDGKKQRQGNGAELTAGCVSGTIRVAGQTSDGKLVDLTLKRADDQGIQLDEHSPDKVSFHYVRAGAVHLTYDEGIKLWHKVVQPGTTGIPTAKDKLQGQEGNQQPKK